MKWIPSERNCADRPSRDPWLKVRCPSLQNLHSSDGVVCPDASRDGCASPKVSSRKRPAPQVSQVETEATLAGAPSLLETNKVRRASTQDRYQSVVETFLAWCQGHAHLSQNWDALLTAYLNELYAQGHDISAAEYVFAAFRYRFPEYGKNGSRTLPRTIQALEGFRNLAPPQMRLPTPRIAFVAVVGVLFALGLCEMGLALLLQWDHLLRPGELISLRPHQIVAPAQVASMKSWGVILAPSDGGSNGPSKTTSTTKVYC